MSEYLVESYERRDGGVGLTAFVKRARAAAEGSGVEHVRSMLVPEDELALHFFKGESAEAVRAALDRAALAYERIVATEGER